MLFPATILGAIATFAAVSIAIVIPREQKDGLYTQSLNEDGTLGEVVLLQEISARSENPASILSKRLPNPQISCSGYSMDKNAYGTAYNSLNSWCDAGNVVAPNSAIWWSSGSTIAYSESNLDLLRALLLTGWNSLQLWWQQSLQQWRVP